MKKFLGFVRLSGFVLMLGVAGSADFANMSFVKVLLLELVGMFVVLAGTSALMHYKRYVRRMMRLRSYKMKIAGRKNVVYLDVRNRQKELCR